MEIQKNDVLGFVRNIEKQMKEKNMHTKEKSDLPKATSANGRLNKVMASTLEMQEEIRSLQTEYSRHQSALALVQDSNEETWQKNLKDFLSSSFRREDLPQQREQFLQNSHTTLSSLKNEILKKEVVVQNIFSASSLSQTEGQTAMDKILTDSQSLKELVVSLRLSSVKKLTDQ